MTIPKREREKNLVDRKIFKSNIHHKTRQCSFFAEYSSNGGSKQSSREKLLWVLRKLQTYPAADVIRRLDVTSDASRRSSSSSWLSASESDWLLKTNTNHRFTVMFLVYLTVTNEQKNVTSGGKQTEDGKREGWRGRFVNVTLISES